MTTTYTFEQLKEDVKKEAEALRVHATAEELGRLKFETLRPRRDDLCIYGQMCSNCHSVRALTLIQQCTPRFFKDNGFTQIAYQGFAGVQKRVNGETVDNFIEDRSMLRIGHFSAIEAYILLPEARNANLIAYLKGETDTLEL